MYISIWAVNLEVLLYVVIYAKCAGNNKSFSIKLKAIKPRICQELEKNKQEESYRVQRRLIRVMVSILQTGFAYRKTKLFNVYRYTNVISGSSSLLRIKMKPKYLHVTLFYMWPRERNDDKKSLPNKTRNFLLGF